MSIEREQQQDWEELSKLRQENEMLKQKVQRLDKRINELLKRLCAAHGVEF